MVVSAERGKKRCEGAEETGPDISGPYKNTVMNCMGNLTTGGMVRL
jgi:hypothetical protein